MTHSLYRVVKCGPSNLPPKSSIVLLSNVAPKCKVDADEM